MDETLRTARNSILSATVFFLTLAGLSYSSALVSGLTVNDKVAAGSGLTAMAWNKIIDSIVELDTRTAALSSSGGNAGIGTAAPSEKLEVNGSLKISGNVLMGYERVNVDCNNVANCAATCTTGKKILGGGCVRINGGANNLQDAHPSSDILFNCSWATAPVVSRAYAICARIGN